MLHEQPASAFARCDLTVMVKQNVKDSAVSLKKTAVMRVFGVFVF
jgi:hypothetical protein